MNTHKPVLERLHEFNRVVSRRDWLRRMATGMVLLPGATRTWAATEPPARLRVMCFNIRYGTAPDGENHWDLRKDLVARVIHDFNPDLIGLQEVLEGQAIWLQELLPEHGFHGVGRDDGQRKGEYVPVMWRRQRFEWLDDGHLWLSETPEVAGSRGWDAAFPRMLSWVLLRDKEAGGRELVFANTHFDHRGQQARAESARLIRDRAESQLVGRPAILVGDFNATEDDEPYRILTGPRQESGLALVDSHRVAHPERKPDEATYHGWKGITEGSRIDWILHSRDFTTLNAAINRFSDQGRLPSDHYPVEAVLQYRT